MSGLYVFNRISEPYSVNPETAEVYPFNGTVPPEISLGTTTQKNIIFTFDAGSGTASVVPVLNALKKHGIKSTFFMTGQWVLRNPELARMIVADGHEVFNHSFNHPHLTELSDELIAAQLRTADEAISDIIGSSTKPYFRPPYGDRDARVLAAAAKAGYQSVYWTADAGDWMESEGMTSDEVKYRIFSNLRPGAIILMHLGDSITGTILDEVITEVERLGYETVSLTQGL